MSERAIDRATLDTGAGWGLATLTLRTELVEDLMDFLEDTAADHEQHPDSCDEPGRCVLQEIVDSIKQDTKNSTAVGVLADRYQRMVNRERALLAGLKEGS